MYADRDGSTLLVLGETKKNSRFPGNHCRELVWAGEFFLFFFENLMLDCMHKFRARSHKISTPSSRYGFSHDLHVFFFDVHVENTGMTLKRLPSDSRGRCSAAGMKIEYERV